MKTGRRYAKRKKTTPRVEVKELSDKKFETECLSAFINVLLGLKKIEEDFKNLTEMTQRL